MKLTQLDPFGALVEEIDLSARRSAQENSALLNAFNDNNLLVVRDQILSDEDHIRILKDLFPGEDLADEGGTGNTISYVSNIRPDGFFGDSILTFHSDFSFTTYPTRIISLYGTEVESGSSPTEFSNSELALQALPSDFRAYLDDKQVVSATNLMSNEAILPSYNLPGREDLTGRTHEEIVRAAWPVIMNHPRTGRPLVYVNEMHAHHLRGIPLAKSRAMLERLRGYLYSPDMIYTHEWREGDFVLWDNIALAHGRRATAVGQAKRTLRRVRGGGATLPMMTQLSQRGIDDSGENAASATGMALKRAVGEKIRAHRMARGLTQQDLSGACGIRYERICQFEVGSWLPSEEEFADLAVSLVVDPAELAAGNAECRATPG